jgi:N-acetylmuramoyl-L-alanine amidase
MKHIYLTAGHGGSDPGAVSNYGVEAKENRKFVISVAKCLYKKYNIMSYSDEDSMSLGKVIAWLKGKVKKNDVSIDVHFNAGPPSAHGCEVIIPNEHTEEERLLAKDICNALSLSGGFRNRGVKTEADTARKSIGILRQPHIATNVLIEVCFISSKSDMYLYGKNYDAIIEAVSYAISKHVE